MYINIDIPCNMKYIILKITQGKTECNLAKFIIYLIQKNDTEYRYFKDVTIIKTTPVLLSINVEYYI